jgi:ribosomal-protein-alanine N-acetyltransferase
MSSVEKTSELNVLIRVMTEADLPRVMEFERAFFTDPWSENAFREAMAEPDWRLLVAQVGEEIVGYACYVIIDIESHLTNIAVAESFRRKSVAKQLLEHILRVVREANCQYLLLEVRPSNTGAVAFYRKHGFQHLYRRPRYYRNPVEDALVMVHKFDET